MKKILLIEDDVHLQLLLKDELSEEGYELQIASCGQEALSRMDNAKTDGPDLIIMDIRMPGMDGLETMGHIISSRRDTPVIIHSAYAGYKNDVMAKAADAYVIKSPDTSELKSRIHELIETRSHAS
ncbi:MAG: response regulator [Thermodesulfobacteriota bacterium]|nr:response regulator [Thermodesulfobacteriota bacterium]